MAIPKVFVSSTCYDLQEERAQLERFIINYGFNPVLSEYSGVYYDVDAHTHDSCVNEVAHCDLFVLIISGRYGGKFQGGNGESITQAEYNKARDLGLPIFTFVKADVHSAQHYYKENIRANDESFAKQITYPAIAKQSDSVSIFKFIDSVHRSSTNNGIETYQSFSDIEKHLKKQWAGMFFSFLQKRKDQDKVENILFAVDKLVGTTTTLESLVENLHNESVGEQKTRMVIENSEIRYATQNFFETLKNILGETLTFLPFDESDGDEITHEKLALTLEEMDRIVESPVEDTLDKYIRNNPLFDVMEYKEKGVIGFSYSGSHLFLPVSKEDKLKLNDYFENGLKLANEEIRREVIFGVFSKYIVTDKS
ncbi:DUF4062 domain-containing protein [Photobacterium sp. 53610]|uniref:DUF4062 domain-containing protein n=1 Tax=Photobacterium sp. 53610 TaxID=3102789 RepID=UPI002ED94F4D